MAAVKTEVEIEDENSHSPILENIVDENDIENSSEAADQAKKKKKKKKKKKISMWR